MQYTFEDEATGEEVLLDMSMHDAVPIGSRFIKMGRKLVRKADMGAKPLVSGGVAHVSRILQAGFDEHGQPRTPGAAGYTKKGEPIIESQADIDRIMRLNPGYKYDKDIFEEPESNAQADD